MMNEGKGKLKSLEDFLAEMAADPDEPETPSFNPISWHRLRTALDEMKTLSQKIEKLCEAEYSDITAFPHLVTETALRQKFVTKAAAALVELEGILYLFSNESSYDSFEISQYISTNEKADPSPVSIRVCENHVLIRMPYLPAKYNGLKDLCNHLLAARIHATEGLPKWKAWNAAYYHVFPTDTADIPKDVDNYTYKRTNDILAYALGTSDNARRFSMSASTILTDALPAGTYIEITPKSSENMASLLLKFTGI